MLSNNTVMKAVKENTNKVVLDALPNILYESAHEENDTQKYFSRKKGEVIPVAMDDSFAKRLSYLSTNLTKRLIILNNKTDGFFGPEIRNVEGNSAPYAWRVIKSTMEATSAKFYDSRLNDEVYETFYAVIEYAMANWNFETINATEVNHSVWAIVFNAAHEMQLDNRFLRKVEVSDDAFLDVAARVYNDLLGFAAGKYKIFKSGTEDNSEH